MPALAITYASYAWWEQRDGLYRADTLLYMRVLMVPVVVLVMAVVVQSLYTAWRATREGGAEPGGNNTDTTESRHYFRPALLICSTGILVYTINWLGYLISFTLFILVMLIGMGVRSIPRIVIITAGTVLMLHVVFIEILDQPLPRVLLSVLMKLS
ncbi:tripartite tricarboxylate transporter TctB family protein [Gammaproteobacteria bacterium]|nr:tripartite tricarboxylate transporter TctB family protein [Gammaproteobacteria bacterium]